MQSVWQVTGTNTGIGNTWCQTASLAAWVFLNLLRSLFSHLQNGQPLPHRW